MTNILPPTYSNATATEMNDHEMTVQLSGSNYVNTERK